MCTRHHTTGRHLTQEDRAVIEALHAQGSSCRAIADCIHKHYSTIGRELSRNRDSSGTYTARYAHKKSVQRRLEGRKITRKIENNSLLEKTIEEKLRGNHERGDWSPAVIAHVVGGICHQTIYSWIKRSQPELRRVLPRRGKYRRQYGSKKVPPSRGWMSNIRSIDDRPTGENGVRERAENGVRENVENGVTRTGSENGRTGSATISRPPHWP